MLVFIGRFTWALALLAILQQAFLGDPLAAQELQAIADLAATSLGDSPQSSLGFLILSCAGDALVAWQATHILLQVLVVTAAAETCRTLGLLDSCLVAGQKSWRRSDFHCRRSHGVERQW